MRRRLSRRELAKRVVETEWQRTRAVVALKVDGCSMGTTIPDGSTIQVSFHEFPPLRRGDLIYLRRGETRVVHRLMLAVGPVCLEKGDANCYPRLCWRKAVIGVVAPACCHKAASASASSRYHTG
ncbi:MAG: S24 family peptidase [bacterium]|nr:S24 family peptidase [bacterium]